MKTPLVSVVMITYNHEKYIETAIKSVLTQKTTFPFELIIGDDASSDSTPEIIKHYAKQYPDIIVPVLRSENLGAIKNGLDIRKRARGTFIAHLEGDDNWCCNTKLQLQVDFLNKHPDYIGIFSWCNVIDHKGKPLYYANGDNYFLFHRHTFTMLDFQLGHLPGQYGTGMYRNIYQNLSFNWKELFNISSIVGDQIVTFLLCLNQQKIYVTRKRLSNYRYITSGSTAQNYFSMISLAADVSLENFRYYNHLETVYSKLTGKTISLRPRKASYLFENLKIFKKTFSLSALKRCLIMLKEDKHPFRLIIDGIYINIKYRNRYTTSDKEEHSGK